MNIVERVKVDTQTFFTLTTLHRYREHFHIPDWQRHYVWSAEDAIKLLESMVYGYPIGAFLFWEYKYPSVYIVDGQQRATTILGATLWRPGEGTASHLPASRLPVPFKVFYGFEQASFIAVPREAPDPDPRKAVALSTLSDNRKFSDWAFPLFRNDDSKELEAVINTAGEVYDALRNHQSPFVTVRQGTSRDDVIEIFKRINTAGQPLDMTTIDKLLQEAAK